MRFEFIGLLALAGAFLAPVTTTAVAADQANFNKSCAASPALLAMFAKAGGAADADRQTLCTCVGGAIDPQFTQAQIDLLAANVSGDMTQAQRDAYDTDETLQGKAMASMNGCLTSTGVAKDYGG